MATWQVLEHAESGSSRINLKAAVFGNEEDQAPVVLFLSGGPGDSGIQWASHGPFLEVFQQVAQSCLLVLLDQRGTGQSERNFATRPLPIDGETFASKASFLSALLAHLTSERDRLGEVQGYTAASSAGDLAMIAESFAPRPVVLWGYSYGTHLAQHALRRHPSGFQRAVLCGFEGPDQTFKLPCQIQEQGERLDRWAQPQGYRYLESLQKSLDRAPYLVLYNGHMVAFGSFALQHLVASWQGIRNRFVFLPHLLQGLAAGDTTAFEVHLATYIKGLNKSLTFYAKDAASGASPDRWSRIQSEEASGILGNASNFPFPEVGEAIGAARLSDADRLPLDSEHPLLIFTGSLDGFTPTSNAVESLGSLPNAVLHEIENASHSDLITCPEANAAMGRFMATGQMPTGEAIFRIASPAAATQ